MQDGASVSGEDASAWLRQHFANDPEPEVRITWDVNEAPDPDAYSKLLNILFAPRADRPAA